MNWPIISIKNRPLGHYLLSIFSLLLQGAEEVILKSRGSLNGKNSDLAYLIAEDVMPYTLDLDFRNSMERIQSLGSSYKASVLTSVLKLQKARMPDLTEARVPAKVARMENTLELDLCELELLIALVFRSGIETVSLSTTIDGEDIELGKLDMKDQRGRDEG